MYTVLQIFFWAFATAIALIATFIFVWALWELGATFAVWLEEAKRNSRRIPPRRKSPFDAGKDQL